MKILCLKTLILISHHCCICLSFIPDTQFISFIHSVGENMELVIFTGKDPKYYGHPLVSYAVQELSALGKLNAQRNIFCTKETLAIFVEPSNSSDFIEAMKMICGYSHCTGLMKWTPYIFLIWPNQVSSTQTVEKEILDMLSAAQCSQSQYGNAFVANSDVYILIAGILDNLLSAYELYTIKNMTIFQKVIHDYPTLTFEALQAKVVRRRDLRGVKLRAVGSEMTSFFETVAFKEVNGELILYGGYNSDYFNAMVQSLNIRVVGVRAKSGPEGAFKPDANGSVTGIGKQLLDDEADVSIMHSEYLPYRAKVLSFLHPHYASPISAFFRQPATTSIRDIYIRSIKTDLRIAMIFTWIFLLASLVAISIGLKHLNSAEYPIDPLPDTSVTNALHWGIAALCQQGSPVQPISTSMKIGVIVSLAFGVIIYIAFSASVVSQLSIPVIPIKSFEDLLRNDFRIYLDTLTQSAKEYAIKAENDGVLKPLPGEKRFISTTRAAELIEEGQSAYLSVKDEFFLSLAAVNRSNEFRCKIVSAVKIDPIGLPVLSGMYVRKDSPYNEFLKYSQLEMREYGIHHRLHEDYVQRSSPRCQLVQQPELPELGLNDTLTAFTFLVVLTIISLIILCVEMSMKRRVMPKYSLN